MMARPPRILLVGNYAPDRQHSMQRYAQWLTTALRSQGWMAELIEPKVRLGRITSAPRALRKWLGFIDKFVLFARDLRRAAAHHDLVHICDHSNAPYLLALPSVKASITCHDLIPIKVLAGEVPGQMLPGTGRMLQRLIRFSLRRAAHAVFVSDATRSDYFRLIQPLPDRASSVIANPVIGFGKMTAEHARNVMAAAGLPTDRRFLLHVGSNLWYKNRAGAIGLFGLLRQRLEPGIGDALLISVGPPLPAEVARQADGWRESLIVVSEAADDLIEALYTRAEALLFPSLDEGFGWPIVEAQACGCPVITSDRAPMRDIAGAAALLIDPTRPNEAAAMIAARWEWLVAQREAARGHAARFDEAAAARSYAVDLASLARRDGGRDVMP